MTDARSQLIAFKHFILSGHFPWWFSVSDLHHNTSLELLFDHFWVESLTANEAIGLKKILEDSSAARIRLVNHFTAEWLVVFLEKIDLKGDEAVKQYRLLVSAFEKHPTRIAQFHEEFWKQWINNVFNHRDFIHILLLLKNICEDKTEASQVAKLFYQICHENKIHPPFDVYVESLEIYFDRLVNAEYSLNEEENFEELLMQMEPGKKISDGISIDDVINEILNKTPVEEKKQQSEEEFLFTDAAGIVILHPFLVELFSRLGLWDTDKWKTEQSYFKALQILSWLAYGENDLPEHRMLILKILAGIDIEIPVPAVTPISDEEKLACTELLQAVIDHWTALRSTSPDGLREAFLVRGGKLVKTPDGYHLIVEQLAQDVLLSHLPWGFNMIKLPWMNCILNTTWL